MFVKINSLLGVNEVEVFWELSAADPLTFHRAYNRVREGRSVVIGYDKEAGRVRLYRRVRQAKKHHKRVFQWMALSKKEREEQETWIIKKVDMINKAVTVYSPFLNRRLER